MKIYTIVVYSPSQKPYSASLNGSRFKMDPHEKFIRNNLHYLMIFPRNRAGIHMLINPHEVYQAYLDKNKIIIIATDIELDEHSQIVLLEKVLQTQSEDDLAQLIKEPTEAIKSKVDKIKEEVDETKGTLITITNKLRLRGENLQELLEKVEDLERSAQRFKQKSTELKNKSRSCFGLFTLYYKVKGLVFKDEPYEYEYRATSSSSV